MNSISICSEYKDEQRRCNAITTSKDSDSLSGKIHHIVFYNEETMYAVARLETSNKTQETIVGVMPAIQAGETIHCKGTWERHPEHGKQFSVLSFRFELPTVPDAIVKFIGTKFAHGIGPGSAQKIVDCFGTSLFDILTHEPEKLYTVTGLNKKRADALIDAWKTHTTFHELLLKLLSWGITRSYALKIIRKWGHESLQTISENPYKLAKEIHGIGFLLADSIAKKVGFPPESPQRLRSGCEYLLWEQVQEGHTCYPLNPFIDLAAERLGVQKTLIENAISDLIESKDALFEAQNGITYLAAKGMFASEQAITNNIARLQNSISTLRKFDADKAISWASTTLNLQFAEEQKAALKMAIENPVSIITGGPGTGKSTITKALIAIISLINPKVLLAAPTGRAAKRLSEITHKIAHTIHRLLKFDPKEGRFQHGPDNPVSCSLIIIDEVSMLDTPLAAHLLRALPSGCKVVFIGDVHQLPSVGPGNILKDLIQAHTIPTTELKTIFRQASYSTIVRAAHRINQGELPPFNNHPRTDYFFIEEESPENIPKSVVNLVSKRIPDQLGYDPRKDIQVLIPMRKGICGIDSVNIELQKVFSSETSSHRFRIGDKVIQMRNNYQKGVFNGDVGIVTSIAPETRSIKVLMDDIEIEYDDSDRDEIALAWAISVHKYQGSEAPCIVIVCHTQHFKLLTRNLLYTAVTRGKKHVFVVGTKRAVAISVKTQDTTVRYTGLKTKLKAASTTNPG